MKRQSIQSLLKLNAGFSLGILLVLGAGSTTAMLELNSAVNELTSSSESVRTQMDADMMHDALRGDVLEAIKLQLMADSSGKAAVLNAVDEHGNRLLSNLGENRSNPDNQELAKEMDEVSRVAERYVASARQMTKDAAGAVPTDKQWEQFMADFESLEQSMEKLSDSLASKAATAKASSRTVVELALAIMIGLVVLAITGVFVIVRRLGKSIGQPLDALVKTVTRIDQQGDLSLRAENRHNNEIGDVIKAFNALMESKLAVLFNRLTSMKPPKLVPANWMGVGAAPWSNTAVRRCCRLSGVDSVQKRKLKSTTQSPGITLLAPVPAWMLLTCQLVGGKKALPSSQRMLTSSASAGARRWIGLSAKCG